MEKLIFIFLILISSCKEVTKTQDIENNEKTEPKFELAASNFVILTYQPKWHWTFENAKPTELSNSELIEIENIIKKAIKENNEIQKSEVKFNGYKRQYVPIINNKGQKEVFVNFFCNDFGANNWKTELVQVEDGGNCYYNLKFNLVTKTYKLEINYNVNNGQIVEPSKIDSESIKEIKKYIGNELPSIYDYYRQEETGDYMTWSDKMFGRCCSNTDLTFNENLFFKISSNLNDEKYPITNLSDTQYSTAFVFKSNSEVKIYLQLDLDKSFLQGKYSNKNLFNSDDIIMNPIKLSLINGYVKTKALFYENGRVKELEVYVNNRFIQTILLMDSPLVQEFEINAIFKTNDIITLEPKTYYKGTKYDEICISEIQSNLGETALPSLNKKYNLMELINKK